MLYEFEKADKAINGDGWEGLRYPHFFFFFFPPPPARCAGMDSIPGLESKGALKLYKVVQTFVVKRLEADSNIMI